MVGGSGTPSRGWNLIGPELWGCWALPGLWPSFQGLPPRPGAQWGDPGAGADPLPVLQALLSLQPWALLLSR